MPSWKEYKEIARSRGALAFELYVVESTPAGSLEEMQDVLPDHLAFQKRMESEGVLFLAGPLSDSSGEQMSGGGMMVYRAASMDEARSFAQSDPMHKSGRRTFIIRRWLVNEGALSIGLRLSEQKAVLR